MQEFEFDYTKKYAQLILNFFWVVYKLASHELQIERWKPKIPNSWIMLPSFPWTFAFYKNCSRNQEYLIFSP